ncbi:hypothetical protein BVY03_02720 [bacterium K02(2017)]|nr:hypothetical protein BVY03_02720 [bacterium K02(2017)]
MDVSVYSTQLNLLSEVQQLNSPSSNRVVLDAGKGGGTSLGSLNHFNSIIFFKSRFNELDNNTKEAYKLLSTAEAGLNEIASELGNLRDVVYSATDPFLPNNAFYEVDRSEVNQETGEVLAKINTITDTTTYGGIRLLDGSFDDKTYEVKDHALGAINETLNQFVVSIDGVTTEDLGLNDINVDSISKAESSVEIVDEAIGKLNHALIFVKEELNQIRGDVGRIVKDDVADFETRQISFDIDFTTGNSHLLKQQANNRPNLNYLNRSVDLGRSTFSFYI